MPGREEYLKVWESFWTHVDSFVSALARCKAQNVNTVKLRGDAKELAQSYFREARKALQQLGVTDETTKELDSKLQRLIELSIGRNSKTSYLHLVREIKAKRAAIETSLEFLIGVERPPSATPSGTEEAILGTLLKMVPSAGASYQQALLDIQQPGRVSFRGTAAEIREVVREVLDHLAPDDDVKASAGFKLEAGLDGPSMKQKVRFILKARKVSDAAIHTAEGGAKHLDESIPSLARSVYNRGSVDLHTARAREEVLNFKLYAEALLGELLEIHKAAESSSA